MDFRQGNGKAEGPFFDRYRDVKKGDAESRALAAGGSGLADQRHLYFGAIGVVLHFVGGGFGIG